MNIVVCVCLLARDNMLSDASVLQSTKLKTYYFKIRSLLLRTYELGISFSEHAHGAKKRVFVFRDLDLRSFMFHGYFICLFTFRGRLWFSLYFLGGLSAQARKIHTEFLQKSLPILVVSYPLFFVFYYRFNLGSMILLMPIKLTKLCSCLGSSHGLARMSVCSLTFLIMHLIWILFLFVALTDAQAASNFSSAIRVLRSRLAILMSTVSPKIVLLISLSISRYFVELWVFCNSLCCSDITICSSSLVEWPVHS